MARNADREMELWEHLGELRGRIFRAMLYLVVGMAICWVFYDPLRAFSEAPLRAVLPHAAYQYTGLMQPFLVQMQISLVAGLILAPPLITLALRGIVVPGLTRVARKG